MDTGRGKNGNNPFTDDNSEEARVSMHSLLDDAGQYLASEDEELTVDEVGRLFDDVNSTAPTYFEESTTEHEEQAAPKDDESTSSPRPRPRQHPFRHRFTASSEDIMDEFENASVSSNDTLHETFEHASVSNGDTPSETVSIETMKLSGIELPDLVYPRSHYAGPLPMKISSEREVIFDLSQREVPNKGLDKGDEDFLEFELSDFCVYVPPSVKWLGGELVSLNNLGANLMTTLLFDGVISNGSSKKHYVEGVPFHKCPLGNFGEDEHQVGGEVWIQSALHGAPNVYYKLRQPAREYRRFHAGFLWVANLAKFVIDYLDSLDDRDELATLQHFQKKFMQYLVSRHGDEQCFQTWHGEYKSLDFGTAINAHVEFIYNQAMTTNEDLGRHLIWDELLDFTAIPAQRQIEKKTIVTPYVYECFKGMKYSHWLKAQTPVAEVVEKRLSRVNALQMPINADLRINASDKSDSSPSLKHKKTKGYGGSEELCHPYKEQIYPGDVLGVFRDETRQHWKGELDELWYIYVTKVRTTRLGKQMLDVIWLYKPADTVCGNGRYPFDNELFFSNHCNCAHEHELDADDVFCKVSVAFNSGPTESSQYDFFVRSTYMTSFCSEEEQAFVTFQDSHRHCQHQRVSKSDNEYKRGETVLIVVLIPEAKLSTPSNVNSGAHFSERLDPAEIVDFSHSATDRVRLRRLYRRNEIGGGKHAPNELVYTDEIFEVGIKDIVRKCSVRFYTEEALQNHQIPAPYSRSGTGDYFFITTRRKGSLSQKTNNHMAELRPIDEERPKTLIEGFDPSSKPAFAKLRGLDLFCGGGNFGRGLAEGGAVSNRWAVDSDKNAIHTYAANPEDGPKTSLFLGSVNDMLSQGMRNNPNNSPLIPLPGDVDFIAAGSPCQAFSRMNSKRETEQGMKNQSLVASVAAYIDFYRPKYAFLENVASMASGKSTSALAQLACAMVGLGYQLQIFKIDAWSCGSPQSRCRIIVSLTAPGYQLPPYPAMSHSLPSGSRDRSLGQVAGGSKFGLREFGPTPFSFVSAVQATEDLPNIGDAQTKMCIPYPDHVVSRLCLSQVRGPIKLIPRHPRGLNFMKTFSVGRKRDRIVDLDAILITNEEAKMFGSRLTKNGKLRECFSKGSKSFGRIRPDGVFPPILCVLCLPCSRSGTSLHWDQHRPLTIMEARRAQDFPDYEVLTGSRPAQLRIMGNSVPRSVALALGLSLRTAWLKSGLEKPEVDNQLMVYPNIPFGMHMHPGETESLYTRLNESSKPSGALVASEEERAANSRGAVRRSTSIHFDITASSSEEDIKQRFPQRHFQRSVRMLKNPLSIPDSKRRKVMAKQSVEVLSSETSSEAEEYSIKKSSARSAEGAFGSLLAVRADEAGKGKVKLKSKDLKVVIHSMNAESSNSTSHDEENAYDEYARTGGKRRRC